MKKITLLLFIFSFSVIKAQKKVHADIEKSNKIIESFLSCLLPVPQHVNFSSKTFSFDNDWTVENISAQNKMAYECLIKVLKEKANGFTSLSKNVMEKSGDQEQQQRS